MSKRTLQGSREGQEDREGQSAGQSAGQSETGRQGETGKEVRATLSPLNHARPRAGVLLTIVLRAFPLILPIG